MNRNDDFSLEQSEQLIADLKSGAPSEFEQLRSALSLLAHVPEMPPVTVPPVLPSSISQPATITPIRSAKTRRTIVTSVMIVGLFASASLAAAAVTGIGPAVIVNAGHEAAKFVKGVVSGVTHVVTGNVAESAPIQTSTPQVPDAIPSEAPSPNATQDSSQSNAENSPLAIPLLSNLLPPISTESNSHENDSPTPNPSHETQGPKTGLPPSVMPTSGSEDSTNEDGNQSTAPPSLSLKLTPKPVEPSEEAPTGPTTESSPAPTDQPSADSSAPSPAPTDQPQSDD